MSLATRTIRLLAAGSFCAFTALGHAESVRPPVTFSSAVNWDFKKLDKLDAWRNSTVVLRKSLAEWYPPAIPGDAIENSSPESLRVFVTGLAKKETGDLSIVYLAGHQTRGGRWQFPRDPERLWPEILEGVPRLSKVPRVVILDACFAEAAEADVLAGGLGAKWIVYTAGRTEEAHEVNFRQRFPIDLTKRYPAEAKWLREAMGPDWNGRISFFGLVWLRTFLATPQAPRHPQDWDAFFQRCEKVAGEFRQTRAARLVSEVRVVKNPVVSADVPGK